MRLARAIAALGLAALAAVALAEPYRDDLALPSYRLLASMLTRFHDNSSLDRAEKALEVIVPLVRALDRKYGTDVEDKLRRAIQTGDRDAALTATTVLLLLDTQDLVEGIHRDDYTGWADAKVRARKAFLGYGLVTAELRGGQRELDGRLVASLGRLAVELHGSDMATSPEAIEIARGAVIADLVELRGAISRTRPGRADAGGGE